MAGRRRLSPPAGRVLRGAVARRPGLGWLAARGPRPQPGKNVRPTAVYGAALRLAVALEHLRPRLVFARSRSGQPILVLMRSASSRVAWWQAAEERVNCGNPWVRS